jgi:hypothetical protein
VASAKPRVPARGTRFWPILTFVVLVIVIGSDERDHLKHLADVDRSVAAAVGSVSVYSLYTDYAERIDSCDYRWLVFCTPKTDAFSALSVLPQRPPEGVGGWAISGMLNVPKLPDATIYALHKRWSQGWAPFALSLVFLIGCVLFAIGCLQERNYIGALFVPVIMLFAMWAIKHVFLLLTSGALLVLEALILIGGIPAALAVCLKLFHESREMKEGVAEVAHALERTE